MLRRISVVLYLALATSVFSVAQFGAPPATKVNDPEALKPPEGSHVAIVEFEDMECPDCARANPLLMEVNDKYKIPWVRHDFPLPFHTWSFQAAVNARFFDTMSEHLGDDYRNFIFASQAQIETLPDLARITQQYAGVHKVNMPFAVDPMGRLAAAVKADYALGQKVGIEHTPAIWVVTDGVNAAPFVEVVDRSKLFQLIDAALAATGHASTLRPAPAHPAFKVAVYIAVSDVERMKDPAYLAKAWDDINSQVHVDKVYIESYRSGVLADGALLDTVKAWFKARGVETAGGIAFTAGDDMAAPEAAGGQFVSFTYTDPKQRAYVKHVSEETARHFDEIVLDDFFFNNTKRDSDIAAKGMQSWSAFRLKLMDEVARNLVYGAAKAVNPKVKIIIKFPNWYEHFQADGYDLAQEPKIFDGIYTGTETREGEITDQHLQQYESYEIVRYFDNVAPGRNGGGWVDTFDTRYIDRYAEQLWDTMLAKAPEIMLFEWNNLTQSARLGTRPWSALSTTFNEAGFAKWRDDSGSADTVTWGTAAGYALDAANAVVGKLGKPIGIASYKPYQSTGEDFLHNYLGMIGIPIDLEPSFPVSAKTVLLTESAKYDPAIVTKIKSHLQQGGNVVITSGLLKALESRGIEQIAEIRATGSVLNVDRYWGAFGAGAGANLGTTEAVEFPEIGFMTNDAWPVVRGTANGRGAPLVIMDHFSKGTFYVLTIPENFNDLYLLPPPVLTQIRRYVMGDFPVSIDAPGKVSLFVYDNNTFVVESYRDEPVKVTVNAVGTFAHIRNLASGAEVDGSPVPQWRGRQTTPRTTFQIEVPPHSFAAFEEEK